MSEFERTQTFRQSIRRPNKVKTLAPQPPVSETPSDNPKKDVTTLIKKLLITQRDFVASPSPVAPTNPRVVSTTPSSPDDDSSHSALMAIQKQINKIEFNSTIQKNQNESPKTEIPVHKGRTRYDEMESLLNTGISDLMTNAEHNDDEDEEYGKFYRGTGVRSSVQGVPTNNVDPKKIKQARPAVRTASDSSHVEIIRKQIKQREAATKPDEGRTIPGKVNESSELKKRWRSHCSYT